MRKRVLLGVIMVLAIGAAAAFAASSLSANRRAAHRQARALLEELKLPPGAEQMTTEPPGHSGFLTGKEGLVASSAQTVGHAWWTVPGTPAAAYAYIRAQPPRGAHVFATGSTWSTQTGITSRSITFQWPAVQGVLDQRLLQATVTPLAGGGTAVLAESDAIWLVPRPRSERIPTGTHSLQITVAHLGGATIATYTVGGAGLRRVEQRFDGLEIGQPYAINCPAEIYQGAREVTLAFQSAGGTTLARAEWTAYAGWGSKSFECNEISFSVAGHPKPALLGGNFFGWLGRELHTSFAAPAHH
jgi:hypothetical protein